MGGFRSKKRRMARKRDEKKAADEKNGVKSDPRDVRGQKRDYEDLVKENASYEAYYKAQKIVPEEDWDKFMNTLRDGLPAAFRITSYFGGQAKVLRQIVEGPDFQSIICDTPSDETDADAAKPEVALTCLPWYPNRLGWQMKLSRIEIRKTESSLRLHNFLISESESGYISRQEAVSMIPPLLLNVKPHHKVLDMCAAPGSKTAQIIELLHSKDAALGRVSGVVVANDVDSKRCYMLVHQAKRLHSPCFVITNHDAGQMPKFFETVDGAKRELKFDRILCDAPCTGDGTIRKNYDVWKTWNPANGNNFHGIQSRILKRGTEMLAKDGLIVYSTCSLNPMEDESVIASTLNAAEGGLELVDVSNILPGLKYCKGLSDWSVLTKELKHLKSADEVEENCSTQIRASMFPPKNAKELNLDRCVRILPHLQDTGGFFVAVIRKTVARLPWESQAVEANVDKPEKYQKRKYQKGSFKEDPFMFLNGDEQEWPGIKEFHRINDDFSPTQLMHRSVTGRMRNIYYLTASAKKLIVDNEDRIKFVNAGVRVFSRISDKNVDCEYRLSQEGLPSVLDYINKESIVNLSAGDIEALLTKDGVQFEELSDGARTAVENIGNGSCILVYRKNLESENDELVVPIAGWKGKTTLRPYIAKNERIHFLRVCGICTQELEKESRDQFEARMERKANRLAGKTGNEGEDGNERERAAQEADGDEADEKIEEVGVKKEAEVIS